MLKDIRFLFCLCRGVKQQQNLVKSNCTALLLLFSFPVSSVHPLLLTIEKLKKTRNASKKIIKVNVNLLTFKNEYVKSKHISNGRIFEFCLFSCTQERTLFHSKVLACLYLLENCR